MIVCRCTDNSHYRVVSLFIVGFAVTFTVHWDWLLGLSRHLRAGCAYDRPATNGLHRVAWLISKSRGSQEMPETTKQGKKRPSSDCCIPPRKNALNFETGPCSTFVRRRLPKKSLKFKFSFKYLKPSFVHILSTCLGGRQHQY